MWRLRRGVSGGYQSWGYNGKERNKLKCTLEMAHEDEHHTITPTRSVLRFFVDCLGEFSWKDLVAIGRAGKNQAESLARPSNEPIQFAPESDRESNEST
jgi:hypothetical protein